MSYKPAIAIIIALVVVSSTGAFFVSQNFDKNPNHQGETHLVMNAHIQNGPPLSNSTNQTSLVINSIVPDVLSDHVLYNASTMSSLSNPVNEIIYDGGANGTVINTYISTTELNKISSEWVSLYPNNSVTVSLEMNAYYRIVLNNSVFVYQYYNNIPYTPGTIPVLSNLTAYFNLTDPIAVFPLNQSVSPNGAPPSAPHSFGQIGPGPCPPGDISTSILATNTSTGPFPLMVADMNLPSSSDFNFGFVNNHASINLEFNSNEGTKTSKSVNYTGTTMSTKASWGATSYAVIGGIANTLPFGEKNVSMIYLPEVTTEATYFETIYYEPYGSNECEVVGHSYSTSIEVVSVQNNNFNTSSSYTYNMFNRHSSMWWAFFNALGLEQVSTVNLPQNANNVNVSYTQSSSGYTSAASAEAQTQKAVSIFVAGVGTAFAVNAFFDVIPLAGSAEDVANEAGLALATYGLSDAIVSAFSSISYSTTTNLQFNYVLLSNQPYNTTGSTLSVLLYESSGGIGANIGGTNYNFNSPVTYLVANPT
jgi:hypothetical protein